MRDFHNLLLMALVALAAVFIYITPTSAQPIDHTNAVPAIPDADVSEEAEADDDDSAEPDHLADIVEEVGKLPGAVEAAKAAEGDKAAMFMAISAIIATVLKILLSLLKLTGASIFKNKYFLKIAPLALGFLIYLFADFAAGVTWYDAIIVAAGGPGAILFNELWKLLPVLQDAKDEE